MERGTSTTTNQAAQLFGYDVIDSDGKKIGSVDNVWVDDATDRLEFLGVKTGWIFGQTHIVPAENAQIDNAAQAISIPYTTDRVKDAPHFAADQQFSPTEENQIYDYYGMQRSTESSPTGYASGTGSGTSSSFSGTTDEAETDIPLSEEELQVGKRQVQTGDVRLRKVVTTERQEVPVELRREEVEIERVPVSDATTVPDTAFQEQEIDVPVMEEQAVVGKEAHVTGQVRVGKEIDTQQQMVGGDVRREQVEVEEEGDAHLDKDLNDQP